MSATPRRASALFVSWSALVLGSSCYSATIDLGQLAPEEASSAGDASSGAGGVGGAGDDTTSAGAGGAESDCDRETALEPLQEECHRFGLPQATTCHEAAAGGWPGCVDGACNVCQGMLRDYPYYAAWHPCCTVNVTCGRSSPFPCNERCPAPTDHDKVAPCYLFMH